MGGRRIAGLAGLVTLLALLLAAPASARPPDPLERYAQTTWASFVAMTDVQSGLPADAGAGACSRR